MTAVATKTLREYFSKAEVEKLSQNDPAWLKEARLKGWQAWEEGIKDQAALAAKSGARWLAEAKTAPNWALSPGAPGAVPEALRPALLGGDWGALSGCRSFGHAEEQGSTLSDEALT